jgi:outer membrane protein TolC
MNDRHIRREGVVAAFAIIVLLSFTGCYGPNFGTDDLGIPRSELREIQGMQLEPEPPPATAPATFPATLPTTTQPAAEEVMLPIDEVRRLALQNNLDLRVELLEPTIARTFVTQEQAAYEAIFVADASYLASDTPTATQLTGSQVKDFSASAGVNVPLITGGTVRLNLPINRFETNNQFSTLNPSYASDFSASISHNLLRGAGVRTNTHFIRVAFYDYQLSQARTKLEVIRVLAATDRVYWRLYAARKQLEVRQKEYELATAQLERARKLVRAGVLPEVEIVRAESGAADTVEAIIIAENIVRDRQRELKRIINEPGLEMGGPTEIFTTTPPDATPYRVDPDRLVATALEKRMEMLETELRIARDTSEVDFARNGTLPIVVLDYTYNVNGLGDSYDASFDMLGDVDFEDHRVGLQVQVPVGNDAARSRLRRALASRMQALSSQEQRAQLITQEVLNAIDQLHANWQRIIAAERRVLLAARVLEVETRQFEQGLRNSTDVLDAQARLTDAQSSEINAITEYQIAQIDIAFAAGMILGQAQVAWDPIPVPNGSK